MDIFSRLRSRLSDILRQWQGLTLVFLAAVVAVALIGLAREGQNREQQALARIMTAQGDGMIRAVEAAGRVGRRGDEGRQLRMRLLLDEMIRQGDVYFVAVVDAVGQVDLLGQSDGARWDTDQLLGLPATAEASWTILQAGGEQAFVVFRQSRPPRRLHGPMEQRIFREQQPEEPRLIAVGLDASAYLRAGRKEVLTFALACGLGLALIFAAAMSMFWRRKVVGLEREVVRQERLAALGTLAAGVAHEIRNPLSSIRGFATYFGQKFAPESKDRELAQVMIGEVDRLNRVVSELLELTHPAEPRLELTDPAELFRHALMLVEGERLAGQISVTTRFQAMPRVLLDRDRILQALLNLLLNAIQAMPPGGTLTVATSRLRDRLELRVADSGPGIPAEHLGRVFDPYFTTRNKGTGLGLPTVAKIVEAHGGRVRILSAAGQGTEVVVELPWRGEG